MSVGSHISFKWKSESCPNSEADSCWLDHGDILVMDGQCQDEFIHCTDPGLEQERINSTFRWIKQHTISCALRTGWRVAYRRVRRVHLLLLRGGCWEWYFFGTLGAPWSLVHMVVLVCWFFPSCLQDSGYGSVPIAGHTLWAEVGGGILCVTLGEMSGLHKNVPVSYESDPMVLMSYTLALVGQHSLRGYYAYMVCWAKEAFWRNYMQIFT